MALLRRLAQLFPKDRIIDGPHKQNLLLPNDPYGLATGFDRSESHAVIMHLLGTPWNRLVNEGLLIEPAGNGFYAISEEGWSAIELAKNGISSLPDSPEAPPHGVPTAFISYSWDSPEHKRWVSSLASKLQGEHGVKTILDQWDLYPGSDKTLFMENGIVAADFVLVVCTPEYARKSNKRTGGVGYEAMVLTSQLAKNIGQGKFIPVLRAGEWSNAMPTWIESKIGVDLRGDAYDEDEYKTLLRALHRAVAKPPPLGPRPDFDADSTSSGPLIHENAVTAVIRGASLAKRNEVEIRSEILKALSDNSLWPGPRAMTGGGYPAVRAAELAEYLSMDLDTVADHLEYLEGRGRVNRNSGTFDNHAPQWNVIPR